LFQSFRLEKVEYLFIHQFVWLGGDIYPTRHIKDWFGPKGVSDCSCTQGRSCTKIFEKVEKFEKVENIGNNK